MKSYLQRFNQECKDTVEYISKLGIHYVGNFDLDLSGTRQKQIFVRINGIEFQIGITRMLELEDVAITSIQFVEDTNELVYIDYQYNKINNN